MVKQFSYTEEGSMQECLLELEKCLAKIPLSQFRLDKKQVTLALFTRTALQEKLPRFTIFEDATPEEFATKLKQVLTTPIGRTVNQLPYMSEALSPLDKLLSEQQHSGFSAGFASLKLLSRTLGKEDKAGFVYFEKARRHPQYSLEIFEKLDKLFSEDGATGFLSTLPDYYFWKITYRAAEADSRLYYPSELMVPFRMLTTNATHHCQNNARLTLWRQRWLRDDRYKNNYMYRPPQEIMNPIVKEARISESLPTLLAKINEEDAKFVGMSCTPVLCEIKEMTADEKTDSVNFLFSDSTGIRLEIPNIKDFLEEGDTVIRYDRGNSIAALSKVIESEEEDVDFKEERIQASYPAALEKEIRLGDFEFVSDERSKIIKRRRLTEGLLELYFSRLTPLEAFQLVEEMLNVETFVYSQLSLNSIEDNLTVLKEAFSRQKSSAWKPIANSVTESPVQQVMNVYGD